MVVISEEPEMLLLQNLTQSSFNIFVVLLCNVCFVLTVTGPWLKNNKNW